MRRAKHASSRKSNTARGVRARADAHSERDAFVAQIASPGPARPRRRWYGSSHDARTGRRADRECSGPRAPARAAPGSRERACHTAPARTGRTVDRGPRTESTMALTHLQILARRFPDARAVLAELANLQAVLTLPTPTVHVVSDVHGEHVKLRQVINNASGSLRPLFERVFAGQLAAGEMSHDEIERLLTLVYYPHETWLSLAR